MKTVAFSYIPIGLYSINIWWVGLKELTFEPKLYTTSKLATDHYMSGRYITGDNNQKTKNKTGRIQPTITVNLMAHAASYHHTNEGPGVATLTSMQYMYDIFLYQNLL